MRCIKHEIWLNGQLALVQVVAAAHKRHKDSDERNQDKDDPATNGKLSKRDDDKHNTSDHSTDAIQQRLLLPVGTANIAPVHHHASLADGKSEEYTDCVGRD